MNSTGEDKLINSFVPETCPGCNSVHFQKYGRTRNNIQRYRCNDCGKTFTPVTGTVFDQHKISISKWMEYTLNILRYVSINADSWNNKNEGTLTATREMLDDMHKRKIDMADEIFVINVGGYIGESTRSEIEYAAAHGKITVLMKSALPKRNMYLYGRRSRGRGSSE